MIGYARTRGNLDRRRSTAHQSRAIEQIALSPKESVLKIIATITLQQYEATLQAMRKTVKPSRTRVLLLRVFPAVVLIFSLSIIIQSNGFGDSTASSVLLFVLILISIFLAAKLYARWCVAKTFKLQKKQLDGQPMEVTEDGISGELPNGTADYHFKWSAFERLIELPDALLFLPNAISFVRLPKESLSPQQQEEIKTWFASNAQNSI